MSAGRARAKEPDPTSLRIGRQYRGKRGMVYELELGTDKVDLHIWQEMQDGQAGGWRVEAHDGHQADALVLGQSGSTRSDALRDVGRAWNGAEGRARPSFDWEAIRALLVSVRAI